MGLAGVTDFELSTHSPGAPAEWIEGKMRGRNERWRETVRVQPNCVPRRTDDIIFPCSPRRTRLRCVVNKVRHHVGRSFAFICRRNKARQTSPRRLGIQTLLSTERNGDVCSISVRSDKTGLNENRWVFYSAAALRQVPRRERTNKASNKLTIAKTGK